MMLSSEMSRASGNVDWMSTTTAPQCLIYGLVDPRTMLVRYVGLSSTGMRRPKDHRCESRIGDGHKGRWIRQLQSLGLDYQILVLQSSAKESLEFDERWWIAYGRATGWPLTNMTDGGEGMLGCRPSAKSIEKTRQRSIGNTWGIGNKSNLGRKLSDDTRAKQSAAHVGKKHSEQSRASMHAAQLGNQKWLGKKHSAATIVKMSAARAAYWAAKRAAKDNPQ